jgi:hypothetical protein
LVSIGIIQYDMVGMIFIEDIFAGLDGHLQSKMTFITPKAKKQKFVGSDQNYHNMSSQR